MSVEGGGAARPRHRRVGRIALLALLALVVAATLFVGLAFPWGTIDGVQVETVSVDTAGKSAAQGGSGETSRRLIVTFTLPVGAAALRQEERADYLNAMLSACEDREVAQRLPISQVGSLFGERRAEQLGTTTTGRHRYRVTYDDWLPIRQGSTVDFVSAIDVGGGPCFSLDGGSMFMGKLWSDAIPLRPFLARAAPARQAATPVS